MCDPAREKNDWSPPVGGCKIGNACYLNGATHPSSTCTNVVCDGNADPNNWTVKGNECLIGNICYAAGAANTTASCSGQSVTCDPTQDKTNWTVSGNVCLIGNLCHAAGATDASGCAKCDPTQSKVGWTPQSTCTKILLAALNEAHTGNLGGITGADALCQTQATAAGYGGVWKAFLSGSTRNVKDLITGTNATTKPVVNLQGQQMYATWSAIFGSTTWATTASYMYTFGGKYVNEGQVSPDWYDARGWTGTALTGGTASNHCNNWTTSASSSYGASGEWDFRQMFKYTTESCSRYLAVGCVLTNPSN